MKEGHSNAFVKIAPWIYVILILTGFSGLSYEITWQLYLSSLLGSDSYAITVVISSFLGGLALGYFAFGRWAALLSPRRILFLTALLELAIGFWGLLFKTLLFFVSEFTLPLSDEFRALVMGITLILPPTFLMGGTLPLLSQLFSSLSEQWSYFHARFYGANTFGGFLGILLTVFLLLPLGGANGALQCAAAGNILAAIGIFFLFSQGKSELSSFPLKERDLEREQQAKTLFLPLLASGCIGYATLSLQVILVRVFSLVVGSTFYLFSIVLGVYIFWLAFGGFFAVQRKACQKGESAMRCSPGTLCLLSTLFLLLAGLLFDTLPYLHHQLRIQFSQEAGDLLPYIGTLFLSLSALLAVPLLCFGAFEPSLVEQIRTRWAQRETEDGGKVVGWCYGWNTIGSILGACSVTFVLLPYFSLPELYKLSILLIIVAAFLLAVWTKEIRSLVLSGVLLLFLVISPGFSTEKMGVGLFRLQERDSLSEFGGDQFFEKATEGGDILFSADGKSMTSVVMEFDEKGGQTSRTVFLSGKADGNTLGDRVNMNLIGLLGSLLSPPSAERLGVIGFGTGMTLGAAAQFEKYREMTVFELDENAPLYAPLFDEANFHVSADPRLRWRIGDALRLLQREREPFDVFISQPSNPWMSGIERLYSREFYEKVKGALSTKGVFVTWFTERALGEEAAESLLFTFRSQFPVFRIFQFGGDYILVGWPTEGEERSEEYLLQQFSRQNDAGYLSSLGFPFPELMLAHEVWVLPTQVSVAPQQSLFHPYLSILGAEDFFTERTFHLFSHFQERGKWFYHLYASQRTLLARAVKEKSREEIQAMLPVLIQRGCGGTSISLREPAWRTERTLCRDSLVAAMVRGVLAPPPQLQPDIEWARNFLDSTGEEPSLSPASVTQELSRYALFSSIFLPLEPEVLVARLQSCFLERDSAALDCQHQVIRTLSLTGHHDAASELFHRSHKEVQTEELQKYLRKNKQIHLSW